MAGVFAPFVKSQWFTNAGLPASFHQLFVYTSGTTTKTDTWTDIAKSTLNANPIQLDASGRADVVLDSAVSYKFVLTTAADTDPPTSPIWTKDLIPGAPTVGTVVGSPWERVAADSYTILDNLADKVGIGVSNPSTYFSVYNRFTVDDKARVLINNNPTYDISSNARSADVWIDAGDAAGVDVTGYGGEFELPASGKVRDLFYATGTLGNDDLSPSDSEFSAYRFELKNKGPNLSSAVRGIIGNVTLTAGGHARAAYFRTTAEAAATGYMTSILAAVHAGAALTAGTAIGLFLHSTGTASKAYAVELTNDAGSGWSAGIVFDDNFSCAIAAIRLRQSATNGRIGWGSTISPYIESTTADRLIISAATATNTRLGIGTALPQTTVHIVGGDGAVASFPTLDTSDFLVLENNGGTGIAIVAGATNNTALKFYGSGDSDPDGYVNYNRNSRHLTFAAAGTERVRILSTGSVLTAMAGALATNATDGFLYVPSCAGAPSGVPTSQTGMIPVVYDSTNFVLYAYAGGAWKTH
jgi:hypothetical protein